MEKENVLPKGWKWIKLEDALEFFIGGDWGKDENFEDSSYALAYCIRGSEIRNWSVDKGRTASLRKIKRSNIEKRELIEGDILVEISGGGPEQPVGRTVLIDKSVLNFHAEVPKICTNFLRLIRPKQEYNSHLLNLFLKLFYYSGEVVKYQGGSNNLRNLKFPDYLKIRIPIPPKELENELISKIEDLFSGIDTGIENLITAQEQLKVYRQAVLSAATSGHFTSDQRSFHNAVTIGIPKEINPNWRTVRLTEVAKLESGHTPRKDTKEYWINGDILWLSLQDIRKLDGIIAMDTKYKTNALGIENSSARLLPIGTVCFCRDISVGYVTILGKTMSTTQHFANWICSSSLNNKFLMYCLMASRDSLIHQGQGTTVKTIYMPDLKEMRIQLPDIKEQLAIVKGIECRLSVADQLEEVINLNLKKAETLKQSILKSAFEGNLLQEKVEISKPKNLYFYQSQILGIIAKTSKEKKIDHGEMTIAKYLYLADKVFGIATHFKFERWHLGPYPPEIKKAIKNPKFFKTVNRHIELDDKETVLQYSHPYQEQIESAVHTLADIFLQVPAKDRAHKTELLATVCKVVEDIQTTDLTAVRASMKEWKIDLTTSSFKNKAEKFSEEETNKCLEFITKEAWHEAIKQNASY